ncbi:MAG: MBL fold metallo-hydrolase [Methanomicrobia archaeon]|nr:MBL fold metallo-hydrolase [Methanomicrobia archaeon]
MDIGKADRVSIYTIIEDYAGYDTPFYAQHGICFLLEIVSKEIKKRILFDTGQSAEPVLYNMKILGIDPKTIDMIFLSHCHYDHTQGLVGILKEIKKTDILIVAHPEIFRSNFVLSPSKRQIGMLEENTRENIEKNGGKLVLASDPFQLMNGVLSTGEIRNRIEFEEESTEFYTLKNQKVCKDNMSDDMSLIIRLSGGIVVVSGCSHAGIVSITSKARKLTRNSEIKAIIGGFHLIDAEEEKIDRTISELKRMNVQKIFTGHCTGLKAECAFQKVWKDKFEKLYSGKIISFK